MCIHASRVGYFILMHFTKHIIEFKFRLEIEIRNQKRKRKKTEFLLLGQVPRFLPIPASAGNMGRAFRASTSVARK
jgi:hypothetical protein